MAQPFGGPWTETKLQALEEYLKAYMMIMRRNARAQVFTTTYVDAFAGPGRRYGGAGASGRDTLEGFESEETAEFYRGSALRALELPQPFDRYVFIDDDESTVRDLRRLRDEYVGHGLASDVVIKHGDANDILPACCRSMAPLDRAVVFLDPFGMQATWDTVQAVADTKKVDLWLLVPLGQAVARMLPVGQPPPEAWQHKLTSFLGTDAWLEKLYRQKVTPGLFGTEMVVERERGHATIVGFIQERLRSAFAHVMSEPLMLLNGRGTPLYMLCFGAGNLRGGKNAVKIAQDIARKRTRG